jgi:tetratricopeptide (TPR) repeat protein
VLFKAAATGPFAPRTLEVDSIIEQGYALLNERKYVDAFAQIDRALRLDPARRHLFTLRAYLRCLTMEQHDREAIEAAENDLRLAQSASDGGFPRAVKGMIAARRGQYREAIGDLTWAIEHNADAPEVLMYRGIAYLFCDEEKKALRDFEDVVRRDPTILQAYSYMARIRVRRGQWKEAMAIHDTVLKRWPDDLQVRVGRVRLALEYREYQTALTDLDRLVKLRPADAEWYFYRACLGWVCKRDLALIKSDLDRAIDLDPTTWAFPAIRTLVRYRRADYRGAMADLGRALLILNQTEFRVLWRVERVNGEPDRIFLGWASRYKQAAATSHDWRASKGNEICSMGLCLGALGRSALGW